MDEKSGITQQPYNPEYNNQSAPPPYPGPQYPPQQQPYGKSANPYPQDQQYNQQYGQQYGQQQGQGGGVTTQQPSVMYVQAAPPLSDPPNDYLCFNIFVTICCCWPIGIFAILKSVATRDATNRGDRNNAVSNSRSARKFGMITLCVGIVMFVITMACMAYYIYAVVNGIDEYDDGDYH